MAPIRRALVYGLDRRGFTLAELMVAATIGAVVLLGLFSLYRGTTRAFNQTTSQVALQRQGTLALQVITKRALGARASAAVVGICPPAGTPGSSLALTWVQDPSQPHFPASEEGTYCYYAGTGSNAGALCENFTPRTSPGSPRGCRDLLGGRQQALIRETGQDRILLLQQTNPASPDCPTTVAAGLRCLDIGFATTANVVFGITNGLDGMAFAASMKIRN